jgi:DNA primase
MIYEFYRRYRGSYFRKHAALEDAIESVELDANSGEAFGVGIIDTEKRLVWLVNHSTFGMLLGEIDFHKGKLPGYSDDIGSYTEGKLEDRA